MLAAAALTLGIAQTVQAQQTETTETRTYPSWFVGVQGGGQAILNGYKVKDVLTPIGAVQGGAYFSPALGARIQVSGWKSKEGIKAGGVDYGTVPSLKAEEVPSTGSPFGHGDIPVKTM